MEIKTKLWVLMAETISLKFAMHLVGTSAAKLIQIG